MAYVGRFAPSPTGPLHFGSLVAAVASYLDAKTNNGKWLVRIEDLDKPREVKGAAEAIIQCLDTYGFVWDDKIIYQSQRNEAYSNAFATLVNKKLIYPCTCTRKEIADSSSQIGIEGVVYPSTCLTHPTKPNAPIAWRIKTEDKFIHFNDEVQGKISQNIKFDVGDFVVKRADGLFAYQLAVVIDDAEQGVTHIVRGADLLNSTPRQIYLQKLLCLNQPHYAHIPIVINNEGQKLSKQTLATDLSSSETSVMLFNALKFLNQNPPPTLVNSDITTCWHWAFENWNRDSITKTLTQEA